MSPAVATVLHNHPDSPVERLPVSWRLPAGCAPMVSEAFYPTMPFRSGTAPGERRIRFTATPTTGLETEDDTLDLAAEQQWAFLELPPRVAPATDRQVVDRIACLVVRFLQRNAEADDTPGDDGPVGAERIAVGVVHRVQRTAIQVALSELGAEHGVDVSKVTVDTANRLQGREFHVVFVLHPLPGRAAASEFHLETGRLCVLLSRHRQACVVVGRAGIADVLDSHPMSTPVWIGAPLPIPDGWEANQTVMERLANFQI